jgi:hypothetical protein
VCCLLIFGAYVWMCCVVGAYVYNIDELVERATISPIEYDEKSRSNADPRGAIQSSYAQETKQLLEMMASNQDLRLSRLASEV